MSKFNLELIYNFYQSLNDWVEFNQPIFSKSFQPIQDADHIYDEIKKTYQKHFQIPWTEEQLFNKEVQHCEPCKILIKKYHKLISQIQQDYIDQYESSLEVLKNVSHEQKFSSMYDYLNHYKVKIQPVYHLQKMCKILSLQPYKTYIPRIPRSLTSILQQQPISYTRHKDSFDYLVKQKEQNNYSCSTEKYNEIDKLINKSRLVYMKCLQQTIKEHLEKYDITYFHSDWKLPFYSYFIQQAFTDSTRISDNTSGGIIYQTFVSPKIPIILKCGKDDDFDSNNLLHEFIVGSFLNKIRNQTPSFCYIYFGFLCTSFEKDFEHMCKVIPINMFHPDENKDEENDFVLTTIIGMEQCRGVSLQRFCETNNNNVVVLAQVFVQLLVALQLAYKEYKFIHGDFHASNIIVVDLGQIETIRFGKYQLKSRYIPQIINFGRSTIDCGFGVLTPFSQNFTNHLQTSFIEYQVSKEGQNKYTSFDILRCLTSLKLDSYEFIKILFKPLYDIESFSKVNRWLQTFQPIKNLSIEDEIYLTVELQILIDSCINIMK